MSLNQCRVARGLLNWTQPRRAGASGVFYMVVRVISLSAAIENEGH
jgi:hypothetical protein